MGKKNDFTAVQPFWSKVVIKTRFRGIYVNHAESVL